MNKFLKNAVIAFAVLSLTACSAIYLHPVQLKKGIEMCEPNNGVDRFLLSTRVVSSELYAVSVTCNNGVKYRYTVSSKL